MKLFRLFGPSARERELEAVNASLRAKLGAGGRAAAQKRRNAVLAKMAEINRELGRMG